MYTVAKYLDPETGRRRWAVLHNATSCWYFGERYGFRSAVKRCAELQAQARAYTGQDARFSAALAKITREGR